MPTRFLFRDDAYLKSTPATVVSISDEGGIELDQTVFYAQGGGQPGDSGILTVGGQDIAISNAVYGPDRTAIFHIPAEPGHTVKPGDSAIITLDWDRRYAMMRAHTALHLVSVVFPYAVTGGSIGTAEGRLDFNIPEGSDINREAAVAELARLVGLNRTVSTRYITDAELDANPGLVKTMLVQPPRGTGTIRLVEIDGLDLQPCGGTHVATTGEIGRIEITKIESKGARNRRVRIALTSA